MATTKSAKRATNTVSQEELLLQSTGHETFAGWKSELSEIALIDHVDVEKLRGAFYEQKLTPFVASITFGLGRLPVPDSQAEAAAKEAGAAGRDLAKIVDAAAMVRLPLAGIRRSPDNNRRVFDDARLQELAESIKAVGVLEPILVYVVPDAPSWEIIAGERRYRAAKLAGQTEISARVVDVTPAEAAELRLVENLKREDLSAIEEAIGYQQLLAFGGTQRQLASRLGIDQSTIANRLRLLRLPEAWQQRVIAREITEAHARELVQYAEHPRVFEILDEAVREDADQEGNDRPWSDGIPTVREWPEYVRSAIYQQSRPCWQGDRVHYPYYSQFKSGPVLFTTEDLDRWGDELAIVYLGDRDGELIPYALNTERWDELHEQLRQQQRETETSKIEAAGKAAKNSAKTPAQKRQAAKLAAEQWAKRLLRYRTSWYQQRIQEAIGLGKMTDDVLLRVLLHYASMSRGGSDRMEDLQVAAAGHGAKATKVSGGWETRLDVFGSLGSLRSGMTSSVARSAVCLWIGRPFEGYSAMHSPGDIEAVAELLGIDLAKEWKVDREFLELHTKEQLQDYAGSNDVSKLKRGEAVDLLLQAGLPAKAPAEMLMIKGVML